MAQRRRDSHAAMGVRVPWAYHDAVVSDAARVGTNLHQLLKLALELGVPLAVALLEARAADRQQDHGDEL